MHVPVAGCGVGSALVNSLWTKCMCPRMSVNAAVEAVVLAVCYLYKHCCESSRESTSVCCVLGRISMGVTLSSGD